MMDDPVNHPAHYTFSKIEVLDAIDAWELNHLLACAVKYIARADRKGNALQDLEKAEFYLKREIERRKGKEEEDRKNNLYFRGKGPRINVRKSK